ncbi:hypothetical protein AcetOrient_orf01859 [Acetobacter orientalis]|uniref:Uncharacterized protein n=1 Tax=Acetobacter orientalis TaxID=146474 RepID=A0A2Z5ZG68_9PROT|nr:hypothetical protein AcetOrient_orf01859 [Acetobacter orientalis]
MLHGFSSSLPHYDAWLSYPRQSDSTLTHSNRQPCPLA